MTHTEFTDLLAKWHIETVDNSRGGVKWYNHNRAGHGDWGPVYGIGNHHTGASDNKSGRDILWNGYGDLPGPLCHGGITADGKVLLNGWGRVNHFGLGDDNVLDHVINENYTGRLTPRKADTDGNARFYGFEWMYDGLSNPETHHPKIYQTAVRLNAAINTWHNWKPLSSIAHGEWQPGKWDPGYKKGELFDVVRFRSHIAQAMKEGPTKLPTRPKPPTPNPTGTDITVKAGDTLMGIAEELFGDPKRWTDIVAANPQLLKPLFPGQKLIRPGK